MGYIADHYTLFGAYSLGVLFLGLAGAISSSPLVMRRVCGFPKKSLYPWIAAWPAFLLLVAMLAPGLFPNSRQGAFAIDIIMAFGLAFSIDNLRTPRWYSRILGAVFGLVFGYILYFQIRDAWELYALL